VTKTERYMHVVPGAREAAIAALDSMTESSPEEAIVAPDPTKKPSPKDQLREKIATAVGPRAYRRRNPR
jgi:hypothetical protein